MKSKFTLRSIFLIGSSLLAISYTHAATLYYDGGTVDVGGNGNSAASGLTGNWNTALLNWDAGSVPYVGWNNSNNDIAFFHRGTAIPGPNPGTVSLTSDITIGGLIFNASTFNISSGANALTFGGTNNTVALNNSVTAATITGTLGTSSSNMTFAAQNPLANHTLTFTGTNTIGWSGTTTVNAGLTLSLNSLNQALVSTTGITLNGGNILLTNTTVGEALLNRVNDTAAISSYGSGSILMTNTAAANRVYAETIGGITHYNGQLDLGHNTTQSQTNNSQTLTLAGLTRSGTTGTIGISGGGSGAPPSLNTTSRVVQVSGITTSTATNEIVGPWLTAGSFTSAQSDWAVYDSDGTNGRLVGADIGATAESTWSTTHAATSNYTLNTNVVANPENGRLTANRNINTLRISTADSSALTVNATNDYITMASNNFANGDTVLSRSTTGGQLTQGRVYYVINKDGAGAGTFQVSTTPGGSAVNLTTNVAGVLSAGVSLNGNTLGTYGIMTGSTAVHGIGGGAGSAITLPTTTSDNLYVYNGAASLWIDAPITDNGAGVLTLVKSGTATGGSGNVTLSGDNTYTGGTVVNAGTVILSGTNTFATGSAGADVINGGAITYSTIAAWGGSGRDVTFNGTGTLTSTVGGYTGGTLTSTAGANAVIAAGGGSLAFATTTGAGNVIFSTAAARLLNLGDASGLTGNLQARLTNAANFGTATTVQFSSIGDAVGSALQFVGGSGDGNQAITVAYNGTSALAFDNRQVQILDRLASNWEARDNIIANNSADAAHPWTINTDLLYTGGRAITAFGGSLQANRRFVLSGSNTGNNAFNGVISNGQNTNGLVLEKAGAGTWSVTGNNTYSGITLVTAGVLAVDDLANGDSSSSVGASTNAAANLVFGAPSATLRYTGSSNVNIDRGFTLSSGTGGGATIESSGVGTLSFDDTVAINYGTANQTRTFTLGGTNTGLNTFGKAIANNTSATSLVKTGTDTWILSSANSYTGTTSINAGALEAADGTGLTTTSILQLRGGVFQSSGTFSRNVSTAAGAVNWSTSSGGFAARGGTLNLQLNGGTGSLTWNGGSFVSTGQTLILGSTSADSLIDFQNSINLGSSGTNTRTITVIDNPGSATDIARISGDLTNTNAGQGLLKGGDGILELTGTNTYTGATNVSAGTLALVGGSQTSAITVATDASLGFTLGSPTTSTASVDLTDGTVKITGSPSGSILLMTADGGITGTPLLAVAIPGYALAKANLDTELWLNSTGASPYDTWAATFLPDDVSDPALNFDNDSLTNLQEFAFGTDPTVSTGGSIAYTVGGEVTSPGLPVAVNMASPGVDFRAVFGRRKDHVAAGLTYTVQFSAGLDVWVNSTDTPTEVSSSTSGDIDAVSVPYPLFIATVNGMEKPTFFRVGVSQTTP
jgi:fibronectin-binding autotransporter adhesin